MQSLNPDLAAKLAAARTASANGYEDLYANPLGDVVGVTGDLAVGGGMSFAQAMAVAAHGATVTRTGGPTLAVRCGALTTIVDGYVSDYTLTDADQAATDWSTVNTPTETR